MNAQGEVKQAYAAGYLKALMGKRAVAPLRSRADILPLLGLTAGGGLLGSAIGATGSAIHAGLTDEQPGEDRRARMRRAVGTGAARGAAVGAGLPLLAKLLATGLASRKPPVVYGAYGEVVPSEPKGQ